MKNFILSAKVWIERKDSQLSEQLICQAVANLQNLIKFPTFELGILVYRNFFLWNSQLSELLFLVWLQSPKSIKFTQFEFNYFHKGIKKNGYSLLCRVKICKLQKGFITFNRNTQFSANQSLMHKYIFQIFNAFKLFWVPFHCYDSGLRSFL